MSRTTTLGVAVLAAAFLSTAQAAPLMERNISQEDALIAYEGVVAECAKTNSTNMTIVVVDRAGQVALMANSNTASPHNLELARRKAYTARTFRVNSIEWRDRTKGNSAASGQRQLVDVIPLGGGVPITVAGDVIGGVGVSGASGGQEGDTACAKGGADAVTAAAR